MSKSRIKNLRAEFEVKYGFERIDRQNATYKEYWRRFKKAMQNGV